jgi:hypothetical protein
MNYTPFDKDLVDIDEQELQKLIVNAIGEGWYIEYKIDFPKKNGIIEGNKIAKSVSSFANTKGGWIFYGIESNDKNIATNLRGIDQNEYTNLSDHLSRIISSNVTPKPVFHFKTVPLECGRDIFIIKIDESPTPPYITSQGIIYQRENNESNPIKDRYIIEKLAEKAEDYYQAIERFCEMDYGETKGQSESDQSYLELYLFPLPYNEFHFKDFFTSDFFKKVAVRFYQNVDCNFELKDGENITIPLNLGFNSIYSSQNSLIIRPLKDENLIYKTTTVELFVNGGLKFLIPIYEFDLDHIPEFYEDSDVLEYLLDKYSPYETVKQPIYNWRFETEDTTMEYSERKKTDFVRHIKMIDGPELIYVLMVIISKYKAVLEDNGFDIETEIGFRARLTNTWRKFIFFDNSDYLDKLKLFNLPIAPKNEVEVPRFIKGNYYTLDIKEHVSFFVMARTILKAIGLPDSATIQFADIINDGIKRYSVSEKESK